MDDRETWLPTALEAVLRINPLSAFKDRIEDRPQLRQFLDD